MFILLILLLYTAIVQHFIHLEKEKNVPSFWIQNKADESYKPPAVNMKSGWNLV
jgi:hypothetical protein